MRHPRFIVALTGGIGTGKSTVADSFSRQGVHVVDTDVLAHAITAPGGRAIAGIRAVFGGGVLDASGALDRPRMRERVFGNADARAQLEALLHPIIREEVDCALSEAPALAAQYVMLAVPLFFETMTYRQKVQRTLVVDCTLATQRGRVQSRSKLPLQEIDRILASQVSRAIRLQLADDVISNGGDISAMESQVARFHDRYVALANGSS